MENPSAYIPLDRRRALATGIDLPTQTTGAALFADIWGFTPLTEALALAYGPRKGADELTHHLNRVYGALIAEVHRYGGSVIGFSGDAITCWFDDTVGDTSGGASGALRACVAARAMQQAMAVEYPGGRIALAIKTAVAAGPVRRFVVGDPALRRIDVLAGAVLERMAAAEHHAQKGELVLDEQTALGCAASLVGGWRAGAEGRFFVVEEVRTRIPAVPEPEPVRLPPDVARSWLLPAVYRRLRTEEGRFLAELRPAVALFLKFEGLDFENDPQAGPHLDAYIRWVQSVVNRYEGSLIQLTTGDKGSYLYVAFGAPVAHDDDVLRAVTAALELRDSPLRFPAITGVHIGISQGRMRVGPYGSAIRRTYGVLGDEVNLAARLMSRADNGQVLVSSRIADVVSDSYRLEALGSLALKGRGEAIPAYSLVGIRPATARLFPILFPAPLVGRDREMAQMREVLDGVLRGRRGHILRLEGSAGVGKSHLLAVFLKEARQRGMQFAVGSCQSTSRSVAYASAGQVARQLLGIDAGGEDDVVGPIEYALTALSGGRREWMVRLPVLSDLLGVAIPDNATTAAFDPQLRQEALTALTIDIVRARARQQPLLLVMEDVHWIDEASWRLLMALSRVITEAPILLFLTHRPPIDADDLWARELAALPEQTQFTLSELNADGIAALVAHRLGSHAVAPLVLDLVQAQAQGNPFFIEELVDALRESGLLRQAEGRWSLSDELIERLREAGCVEHRDGDWQLLADAPLSAVSLGIPDSIHGIVLSRLDPLPEEEKLTIKVASVIGRVFEFDLLARAHPGQPAPPALRRQIEMLSRRDFARLESPWPHLAYIFKHNITQEVVYKTLLDRQQQELHLAVAEQLERLRSEAVERLAFHYRHADLSVESVRRKALRYLSAAGAKAKREYANETALAYYERALALETRWPWLAATVDLLHILGRRDEERATLEALSAQPDARHFDVQYLWAQYYEAVSDYPRALDAAEGARSAAARSGDVHGQVRALGRIGLIHWRQGDCDAAATAYGRALTLLSGAHGYEQEEAEIRYGLGILHRQQGQFSEAQAELVRALALYRGLDNRADEAKTLAALATVAHLHQRDYVAALHYNEQALHIRRAIGDRAGEGASLLALGQSSRALGLYDRAIGLLQEALAIHRALGDRWRQAIVWNELGIVRMLIGQYHAAQQALRMALALGRAINADVGVAYIQVNLGQVFRESGALDAAEEPLLAGLHFAQEQKDRHLEALCLSDLALLHLQRHEYEYAVQRAQAALALFAEMGGPESTTADLATLAAAELALDHPSAAERFAERAQAILEACGGDGPDFPHRDAWTCSHVFRAVGRGAEAEAALAWAYRLLRAQADKITDPEMRRSYLQNVRFNRAIREEAEAGEERE